MPRTVNSIGSSSRRRLSGRNGWRFSLIAIVIFCNPLVTIAADDTYRAADSPRTVISMNDHWRHSTGDVANAQGIDLDDSGWSLVDLPHSYNAADGADGGGYYRGIAWYRKTFVVPPELAGKQLYLQFDGASFATDVYIDGAPVSPKHNGGFSTFNYDVTSRLAGGRAFNRREGRQFGSTRTSNAAARGRLYEGRRNLP